MTSPKLLWPIFFLLTVVTLVATGWVSLRVIRLERERIDEARRAKIEENVSLALWRIDSLVAPLVAIENARPFQGLGLPSQNWQARQPMQPSGDTLNLNNRHFTIELADESVPSNQPTPGFHSNHSFYSNNSSYYWSTIHTPLELALPTKAVRVLDGDVPEKLRDADEVSHLMATLPKPTIRLSELPSLRFGEQNRMEQTPMPSTTASKPSAEQYKGKVAKSQAEYDARQSTLNQAISNYKSANETANPYNTNNSGQYQQPFSPAYQQAVPQSGGQPYSGWQYGGQQRNDQQGAQSYYPYQSSASQPSLSQPPAQSAPAPNPPQVNPTSAPASNVPSPNAAPTPPASNEGAFYLPGFLPMLLCQVGGTTYAPPEPQVPQVPQASQVPQQVLQQAASTMPVMEEGVWAPMQPVCLGDQLLLLRRVQFGGHSLLQGCVFDWPHLARSLEEEISDLLPAARLVLDAKMSVPGRMLVSLPIRIEPGELPEAELTELYATLSPVFLSVTVVFGCVLLSIGAFAVLLHGMIRLGRRRSEFVTAVTHELRTPLTTFRMYSEMLAEGMVEPGSQKSYLQTLESESDRLTHLVENVLSSARLERGRHSGRSETLPIGELITPIASRLAKRCERANMRLVVEIAEQVNGTTVRTNPSAVEQILWNLVDNACKYAVTAADRTIRLICDVPQDGTTMTVTISDSGPGVPREVRRRLFCGFSKTASEAARSAPGVGLGLALSRRLARDLGGELELLPTDSGAAFRLSLELD